MPINRGRDRKIRTESYVYLLLDENDRPIEQYDWHFHKEYLRKRPHLHIKHGSTGPGTSGLRAGLSGLHFPTGRLAIEELARFLIQDMDVKPSRTTGMLSLAKNGAFEDIEVGCRRRIAPVYGALVSQTEKGAGSRLRCKGLRRMLAGERAGAKLALRTDPEPNAEWSGDDRRSTYGLRLCVQPGCNEMVESGRCTRHTREIPRAVAAYHDTHQDAAESTKRSRRRTLRTLEEFTSARGLKTVDQIELEHLNALRSARPISARTLTKELEMLRHFFRFCVQNDWILKSYADLVPMPKNLQVADREPYSPNEVARIIAACDQTRQGRL